jgi:NADP-dependent 3-hydroxy acid dehydrogenase YdfG
MNLNNKIAVVTGVSKGIGLSTVKLLLDNGVKVAGWGRSAPKIKHPNFAFYLTNVRDAESVSESYNATVEDFGGDIAILINNAGLGYQAKMEEMTLDQWHEMFETNVNGIFYCSRLVIPGMKKMDSGHIINISSIAGQIGIEEMSGYCGTKYAVRGISSALYKEVRNFGIKVTCIYPGSVKTNFFDKIPSVTPNDNMMMPEDIASTILHCLEAPDNYHHVDIEVRPLRPLGKKN